MSNRVKIITGKLTETGTCGSAWTLDLELGSLHGTKLGPLHVDISFVALSVCGIPGSGTRIYLGYMS